MPMSGPMTPTNEKLDQVLLELYSLNLTIRDLALAERTPALAPVINLTSPEVDLTPLAQALGNAQPQLDLEALYVALSGLAAQPGTDMSPEVLGALRELQKEFRDLGTGLRAIVGQPSMGGGGAVHLSGPITVDNFPATVQADRSLTERMGARAPATGYHLWLDVLSTDATRIIVAEAPDGSVQSAAVFRGTRVTVDANGNPLGAVETATDFAWSTRSTATWAS